MEPVREADLVIEAVFEDMAVKRDIFGRLDKLARPGVVLASNTSTLDIDAIADATQRPELVVGMHFFSPANVMRLLEIVRGKASSHEAIATAMEVGKRIGKVNVVVGNCDGFVGNRMTGKRGPQLEKLLLEGALPQDVDRVMEAYGMAMGPCATGDLAGLDIGAAVRKARGTVAPIADALAAQGPLRPEDRQGLVPLRREARPPPRPGGRGADPRHGGEGAGSPPPHRGRRDPGAHAAAHGERGRPHPGGGRGLARHRHRRHLHQRLRLAGLAGRPRCSGRTAWG
jgi:3-hydroxyacyl-CoA dehydrogenase